ncbi:MAG: hypothetical protein JKY89_13045 [Immundisolibacteraceae bacterium]|nr:hypothetical protein [Immundisolibacteraceae bacterium]
MKALKQILMVFAVLMVTGCSKQPAMVTTGLNSCEASLANSMRLKRQLGAGYLTSRPTALLSPTNARQSDQMQALRAAAAQDQKRNLLATELKFQQAHCGSE